MVKSILCFEDFLPQRTDFLGLKVRKLCWVPPPFPLHKKERKTPTTCKNPFTDENTEAQVKCLLNFIQVVRRIAKVSLALKSMHFSWTLSYFSLIYTPWQPPPIFYLQDQKTSHPAELGSGARARRPRDWSRCLSRTALIFGSPPSSSLTPGLAPCWPHPRLLSKQLACAHWPHSQGHLSQHAVSSLH